MSTETHVSALIPGVDDSTITVSVWLPVLVVAHPDGEPPFVLAAFRNSDEAEEFMGRVEACEIETPDYDPFGDGYLDIRHIADPPTETEEAQA